MNLTQRQELKVSGVVVASLTLTDLRLLDGPCLAASTCQISPGDVLLEERPAMWHRSISDTLASSLLST